MVTNCCKCGALLDEPYPKARWCRACLREGERRRRQSRTPEQRAEVLARRRAQAKARRAARTPEQVRRDSLAQTARRYGLTVELLEELLAKPCAICRAPATDPSGRTRVPFIDHCHTTGRVRDVLCRNCNSAIGLLGDDPKLIRRAAAYVERHRAAS